MKSIAVLVTVTAYVVTAVHGQGVSNEIYRWPDATVPVEISSQYSPTEAALIRESLAEIEKYTCIKFVTRTNEPDYVTYMEFKDASQKAGSCWAGKWGSSFVGKQGGGQHFISLWRNLGCFKKFDIIHEMLHILGLKHEQQRGDRDDYIYVDMNNVDPNFREYVSAKSDENSGPEQQISFLGTPYDTSSIMHYHPFSFTVDPKRPSLSPKNPCNPIGNEKQLSPIDVQRLNRMYNCPSGKPSPPPVAMEPFDQVGEFNCPAAGDAGKCTSDPIFMNAVCGRTCCDIQKGVETCVDRSPECANLAQKGECTGQEAEAMSRFCRLSCKLCKPKA